MKTLCYAALVLGIAVAGLTLAVRALAADASPTGKVYELRTYKASPGKLDAVHARFRDHTCPIFKKHGIEIVGAWTPTTGDEAKDTLIYIVVFPSVEAQQKAWKEFHDDPEWIKAKAESEKDGVLVKSHESKNLQATDYSPIR
jgi:hypothetical protein